MFLLIYVVLINIYNAQGFTEKKKNSTKWLGWGFCTILTKEKGFGLHGMINRGDMTRKYMRKLMEDEGYFSQVCSCRLMPRWTPSLGTSLSSSWYERRTPSKGNTCPVFRQLQGTAQKVGTNDHCWRSPLKVSSGSSLSPAAPTPSP